MINHQAIAKQSYLSAKLKVIGCYTDVTLWYSILVFNVVFCRVVVFVLFFLLFCFVYLLGFFFQFIFLLGLTSNCSLSTREYFIDISDENLYWSYCSLFSSISQSVIEEFASFLFEHRKECSF